ncbi:MAG: hypothetical protein AABY00_03605 [Nanoarchaeota archaeon]
MKNRKGQEEVVGFVVLVVLVAVVFVLFLGFSSQKKATVQEKTSQDLRHFLESIRVYTTECKLNELYYQEFKDLISACYTGKSCTGKKACEVLNETAGEFLASSFPVGADYPVKGAIFTIDYIEPPEAHETSLLSLSQGNCNSLSKRSADDFFPLGAGQITLKITLCY